MAGVRRTNYTFPFGGATYGIPLPTNYYTNIDTICGFNKATDAVAGKFRVSMRDALRNGALVQIGIIYLKGNRLALQK